MDSLREVKEDNGWLALAEAPSTRLARFPVFLDIYQQPSHVLTDMRDVAVNHAHLPVFKRVVGMAGEISSICVS